MLEVEPLTNVETHFTDVDQNHWAFGDIMAAVLGISKEECAGRCPPPGRGGSGEARHRSPAAARWPGHWARRASPGRWLPERFRAL